MGVGPALLFIFFCFTTCKKIYIQNKKILAIQKKLPECHCIGKRLKYPWISQEFMKMPLAARVAHAQLLLEAAKFSGEISSQWVVDSGRSEVEDSDGGGLDGRWWLTRENRQLEGSVADDVRGLFPARWGGGNDENHRGFALSEIFALYVVVRRLETAGGGRSEERERVAGERRETVWGCTMVWTLSWYTGAAEVCEPLDLWWNDRAAVIG